MGDPYRKEGEMPPEMTDQEFAEIAEAEGDSPAVRALRAERTARKDAEWRAKALEVANKYPGTTLDDFEGLTPDKFESRAQRISSLQKGATPQPPTPTTPEPEPQPSPTEEAFARAAAVAEGVPPVTEGKKLGRNEAWALLQRNPAEYERLRQAGRIDLGVTAEDRGGSVIFHPGT